MKLKHLLIIIFFLVSAVPMFFGLQYFNLQAGEYTRHQFADHLTSLSLIAKKRVLTAVDRIKDNTALIASRTQMRISLAQWNATRDAGHIGKVSRIINDAKNGLQHLKEISIYDRDGRLAASTALGETLERLAPAQHVRFSLTLIGEGSETLAVSVAPLIFDHETVGYIRLEFFADFITDLVRDRTGLGETGEWLFAVRDENGDALFAVPLKYDHNAAFARRVRIDRTDVPITQALLGNETIMGHAPDYRERPVMASTRYIPELDWGLVAKMNEDEIGQLVSSNETVILAAEAVLVVFAIFIGIAMAIVIAAPIEKLKNHTAKVAGGELADPPETGGWHEVRELTRHFAQMVQSLRAFNTDLQTTVEERTKELRDANRRLAELATEDHLTGLNNRRRFEELFSHEFGRAKRYGHDLAVVMLDIDHFKSVNDTYGHEAGDRVLKGIADFLNTAVRDSDVAARLGGEEFCLLLPECPRNASMAFLERVRTEISELEFNAGDARFSVTCSFGTASLDERVSDRQLLLKNADDALYRAKQSGRNRVVQYTGKTENNVMAIKARA